MSVLSDLTDYNDSLNRNTGTTDLEAFPLLLCLRWRRNERRESGSVLRLERRVVVIVVVSALATCCFVAHEP